MINKIKLISVIASALLILGGAFFAYSSYKSYIKMKAERNAYRSNQAAMYDIINKKSNEARVLELSVADLRNSEDSLINLLESTKKSLKQVKNKPGDVTAGISTSINASDTMQLPSVAPFKLDTTIKYNDLTKNMLKIDGNKLISGISINNSVLLFVYSYREYVNKYPSGVSRFLHLDYRKETINKFTVKMTNDLVKVDSVRVYKIR